MLGWLRKLRFSSARVTSPRTTSGSHAAGAAHPALRQAVVEALEGRAMLAATPLEVTEAYYQSARALYVSGTTGNDQINVSRTAGGLLVSNDTGWSATYSGSYRSLVVDGKAGNDRIAVDASVSTRSVLFGGAGDDQLFGGSGGDRLYGGLGRNLLSGGAGDDVLVSIGGAATDTNTGGDGRDSFWVDARNTETITDASYDETGDGAVHRVDAFLGNQTESASRRNGVSAADRDAQEVGARKNKRNKKNKNNNKKSKKKKKKAPKGPSYPAGPIAPTTNPVEPAPTEPTPAEPPPTGNDLLGQDLVDPTVTRHAIGWQNFSARALFADPGPSPEDIKQGQVGDCYFLAVLASIAKLDPSKIRETVVDLGDGTYAVHFRRGGTDTFVRVDGDLAVGSWGGPAYATFGREGSLWVPIVEKAYAYYRTGARSYASLDSGWMDESYSALGLTSRSTWNSGMGTDAALLNGIAAELNAGRSVTWASASPALGAPLVGYHAYTVDAVVYNDDGVATGLRLRNPWGVDGAGNDGNNDAYVTLTARQARGCMLGFTVGRV